MNAAEAIRLTATAAVDHGRPIVTFNGLPLVDVRREFPSTVVGRTMAWRSPTLINHISIHHDAVFFPNDPPGDDFDDELARIAAIYRVCRDERGWGGFPYHTMGFPSGRVYLVGDLDTQRAAVERRNHETLAHCVAGSWMGREIPPLGTQLTCAFAVIAFWTHVRRLLAVLSHRDAALPTSPTACCGTSQDLWVPNILRSVVAIAKDRRLTA